MRSVQDLAGRVVDHGHDHDTLSRELGVWRSSAGGLRVRSVFHGGVWVVEIDTGAPPLEVHELPEVDDTDILAVSLVELELLHEGQPRLARLAPDGGISAAVFVDHPSASWTAWMPCIGCGGYRLPLPFSADRQVEEPDSVGARLGLELAREATLRLLQSFGGSSCPGCNSRRVRSGEADLTTEGEPMVWLDVLGDEPGWQLWLPLEGADAGVTMPLGLPPWTRPEEVDEAAMAMISSDTSVGARQPASRIYDQEEDEHDLDL